MSPDDPSHAATLRVVITDAIGRSVRKPALLRWLRAVAPARARGALTLALVSDDVMRRLNRKYAGKDRPTDVLSFPNDCPPASTKRRLEPPGAPGLPAPSPVHLGDIAIAMGVATRQARAAGHSLDAELRILALHGLLHLLGYDHAVDEGKMARLERRLRRKGGLREGLIDRAGRAGQGGGAGLRRPDSRRKATGDRTHANADPRRSARKKAVDGTRAKVGGSGLVSVGQGFSLAGRRGRRRS